jgi:hypothetical protein
VLSACGGSSVSQPAIVFPSHEEVARLPVRKPRAEAFGADAVSVDAWTFESVPIPEGSAYDDSSPWGDLLREAVKAHATSTALSPPLACAAGELARFHLKKAAFPAESLRRFMAARCGAFQASLTPLIYSVPTPPGISDERLAGEFRGELAKLFAGALREGHHLVGLAAARSAERASIVMIAADDSVRLEPGSRSVDDKRQVTVRGGVRSEFVEISAMVNRGPMGTAPCAPVEGARPPRFAVRCELAPGDAFAWVEVVGRKRDSMLLKEVADLIIYEGDGSQLAYTPRRFGPPAPVHTTQDMAGALIDGLNRVRRDAKLAPLAMADKQSAQNTRLAGTLVDAMIASDDGSAERAALGLLAGWDVDGLIRHGTFFVGVVGPERDANAWLDLALERPLGRTALLDPEARQIAVGPVMPDGSAGVGAAITTYAFFPPEDHGDENEEERFFQRLSAARDDAGLQAPVRITGFDRMPIECALVSRQGKPSMDALNDMMAEAVRRKGVSVKGYVFEAGDLTRVEVPPELLTQGPLQVIVGVTHHRAPGAAWGQYVLFAIVLGHGPELTASAAVRR